MKKYELSKDWIAKNNKLIKQAYNIALTDKYDIKSQKDVLKILELIDSANANTENAHILSKILQLFSHQLGNIFKQKKKPKVNKIN